MSQNLPRRSLRDFLFLRHPNHFVLAGANNRNVIILPIPRGPCSSKSRFFLVSLCSKRSSRGSSRKLGRSNFCAITRLETLATQAIFEYTDCIFQLYYIRASYWGASSGFRLLGEIPAGAIMVCYGIFWSGQLQYNCRMRIFPN